MNKWYFILFWLLAVLLPIFISPFYASLDSHQLFIFLPSKIIGDILLGIYFYLNYTHWTPNWLANKKMLPFVLKIFASLVLLISIDILFTIFQIKPTISGLDQHFYQNRFQLLYPPKIAGVVFYFIVSTISSTLLVINQHREKKEKEIATLETQKLLYELNILKLQISPHFLFNVLNNIRALIRKNHADSENYILNLSAILRFMLYQKINDKILLQDEIDLIQNFITLHTMGDPHFMDSIHFTYSTDNDSMKTFPLLLYPFVENMFKHGTAPFEIVIQVKNGILTLQTCNKYLQSDLANGIGLANVKKRLDYLCPNKHTLINQYENNNYIVHLTIVL